MKFVRMAALLGAAALLAIGVVACGDDDNDGDDNGDGANTPAATQPAASPTEAEDTPAATDETPADGDGDGAITVVAQGNTFRPAGITVTAGEEVTISLENSDQVPHTLTVFEDDAFTTPLSGADTGQVAAGETGEFTFTFEAGQYDFRCQVHPQVMNGLIVAN